MGVRVALYTKPVLSTVRADKVPPATVMSLMSKPTGFSEKVKVSVAFRPDVRVLMLEVMVTVGGMVSAAAEVMVAVVMLVSKVVAAVAEAVVTEATVPVPAITALITVAKLAAVVATVCDTVFKPTLVMLDTEALLFWIEATSPVAASSTAFLVTKVDTVAAELAVEVMMVLRAASVSVLRALVAEPLAVKADVMVVVSTLFITADTSAAVAVVEVKVVS